MLEIESVNHIGIRIKDRAKSVSFYKKLGFESLNDFGFDEGHPIVMRHPGGVTLNILGLTTSPIKNNILMDVDEKYSGYTHIALTVSSLEDAKAFLKENNIEETGSFSFQGMPAVFIRYPDSNVIELDAYAADSAHP